MRSLKDTGLGVALFILSAFVTAFLIGSAALTGATAGDALAEPLERPAAP